MHWAKQARIERMKLARDCKDPERRAEWVAIAKKYHRIYLHDKRGHAKHMAWLREKERRHIASGQLVRELFGEHMDGLGDRPASRELIETDLIEDVMGVLG